MVAESHVVTAAVNEPRAKAPLHEVTTGRRVYDS